MCLYWIGTYPCGCVEEGLKERCDKAPNCNGHADGERREYLDMCEECQGRQDVIAKRAEIVRSLEGEQVEEVEMDRPNIENVGQIEADLGENCVGHAGQDTDKAQTPPKLEEDVNGKWFSLLPECCDLTKGPRPVRRRRGEGFPKRGRTYPENGEWMY
ncbi:hypothetical protein BDW42DRAFT_102340 [Aspergillus taichungensis]|uniref:Uncharacterized protein n=1 Tax=Aspergillus taichungensis TaxID=482145 RepID=A0A2J5HV78_9EURO|nr:hypothetical protein BDW42DRAFT_102340 [Aspergillus taichungensis]